MCDRMEATEARETRSGVESVEVIKLEEVQKLLKDLEAFQATIKETEGDLECIFRQLLKTRVSLLNILDHE